MSASSDSSSASATQSVKKSRSKKTAGRASHTDDHSSRYTAPIPKEYKEPVRWVPWLMVALFVIGAVIIMVHNLVFTTNNWLLLVGIGFLFGGLITATRWR